MRRPEAIPPWQISLLPRQENPARPPTMPPRRPMLVIPNLRSQLPSPSQSQWGRPSVLLVSRIGRPGPQGFSPYPASALLTARLRESAARSPVPNAESTHLPTVPRPLIRPPGAGPSGLVAAKTLLHDAPPGEFQVTIFDPQRHIGGLWPVRKDDSAGLVHPFMIANQSKHTVQFSDLAWEADAPELPRAWQVGRYLERYRDRYCSDAQIRLGWEVVRATPETESDNGAPATTWHVRVRSETGEEQTQMFDLLLVATGYFNRPAVPSLVPKERDIPTIHSSEYRDLETLLIKGNGGGGKILVVGGQMSGIEIAGTIASHLSSAANSPGKGAVLNPEGYSLHHIIQQPTWVFPLYTTLKVRPVNRLWPGEG